MLTAFERIPEMFIEMYDPQFQAWAREFRRRGNRQAILFRRRPGAVVLLDGNGQEIAYGCWLEATVESAGRVVIRPATEHDEEMIERHVREMRPYVLQ